MKRVIILGLIMACSSLSTSCASRQKEVHKEQTQFKYDAAIDTTHDFSAMLNVQATDIRQEESSFTNMHIEYEGEAGDSISVTEYGADGKVKNKAVIQGKGKAFFSKGEQATKAESVAQISLQEDTKLKASGSTKVKGESSTVTKDKNVESSGFSFWIWLWIIIICIVLVLLWYLYRRYGWLIGLKKRVLNKNTQRDTFAQN